MKRFLPIRIHHIYYAYGWWWGKKFYFLNKEDGIIIVDMPRECLNAIYANNGNTIGHGTTHSWSETRQKENYEDIY